MVQALNFVMMQVPDVAAARAFYTEALGLQVEDEAPGFVQFKQPAAGGATYALGLPAPDRAAGPVLWWLVEDIDATHATLLSRGVEVVQPPLDQPFGRTLAVKDPAGNVVHLWHPRG